MTWPARPGPRRWRCSRTGPAARTRGFALDEQTGPAVARLVARLDGMPLAIELAAARVEALGVTELLDRLDDRFALLAGGDRPAPSRQRSLAATVEWSYQLLDEDERRVFRAVSVFPGPFTLEAAEAVAGAGAGPAVLRLVDCSLLVPPRPGPDGRSRYGMLETLRAYGAGLLAEAGEQDGAAAALAGYALRVAEEAAAGLQTSAGEVAAARWLDAEDATMRQVLAWAMDHDPAWRCGWRSRWAGGGCCAAGLAGQVPAAARGGRAGRAGQRRVVRRAVLARPDRRCTRPIWPRRWGISPRSATRSRDRGPSRVLADCLAGRSVHLAEPGPGSPRRPRRPAARWPWPGSSATRPARRWPWTASAIAAAYAGDIDDAVQLARQAQQIPAASPARSPGCASYLLAGCADRGRGPGRRRATPARRRWPGPGTRATCGTCRRLLAAMARPGPAGGPGPGRRRAPARSSSSSSRGPAAGSG